jgi:hypothetical protein
MIRCTEPLVTYNHRDSVNSTFERSRSRNVPVTCLTANRVSKTSQGLVGGLALSTSSQLPRGLDMAAAPIGANELVRSKIALSPAIYCRGRSEAENAQSLEG